MSNESLGNSSGGEEVTGDGNGKPTKTERAQAKKAKKGEEHSRGIKR